MWGGSVQAGVRYCLGVEVRGQLLWVCSLFLLWVLEIDSDCRVWWQISLPIEPSCQALLVRWPAFLGLVRWLRH